MYIRRKVFSVALDENGEERLFSTNEIEERLYAIVNVGGVDYAVDNTQLNQIKKASGAGSVSEVLAKLKKDDNFASKYLKGTKKAPGMGTKAADRLHDVRAGKSTKAQLGKTGSANVIELGKAPKPVKMTKAQIAKFQKEQAAKEGYAKYTLSNAPRSVGNSARGKQAMETFQKYGDRIAKVERRLDAKKWAKRGGIGLAAGAAAGAAGYGAYRALKKNND